MNTHRPLAALAALAVLTLLPACGGTKRPPNVAAGGMSGGSSTAGATPSEAPLPAESGPDVAPLDREAARGEDFSVSDPTTLEGGPLEDVYFDYDQAALGEAARAVLERHTLWLQSHRAAQVTVEGHADERGTAEYNLALGDARARAARDYLVKLGVSPDRLKTVSYGKERPLDPGSSEAAWAKNRRAHFVVAR